MLLAALDRCVKRDDKCRVEFPAKIQRRGMQSLSRSPYPRATPDVTHQLQACSELNWPGNTPSLAGRHGLQRSRPLGLLICGWSATVVKVRLIKNCNGAGEQGMQGDIENRSGSIAEKGRELRLESCDSGLYKYM